MSDFLTVMYVSEDKAYVTRKLIKVLSKLNVVGEFVYNDMYLGYEAWSQKAVRVYMDDFPHFSSELIYGSTRTPNVLEIMVAYK